jgi:hypothetical protein
MDTNEFYERELVALREELHNLKNCQVTFLTSSITATGLLLGIGTTWASKQLVGIVSLFPLVVLLPSWWVFFDKATSITRIVGYYRVLEGLALEYQESTSFVGWENALREFRTRQADGKLEPPHELVEPWHSVLADITLLRTGHRYWVISYSTFLGLSALCIALSAAIAKSTWFLVLPVPAILLLVSVIWNARAVAQLIGGRYSYDCNERFWKQILGVRDGDSGSVSRTD